MVRPLHCGFFGKCSQEQLNFVAALFEHHSTGVPDVLGFEAADGRKSFGFYIVFLDLTKWEADPTVFFKILEVDQKIGWTNPAHVEHVVFSFKGIKIIDDEEVSGRISSTLQTNQMTFPISKIIIFSELVEMVSLSRT